MKNSNWRNGYTVCYPHNLGYFRMYQRPQQMCKALAKLGYKVVFCDGCYIANGKTILLEKYDSGGSLWICYNINNYVEQLKADGIEEQRIAYFSYGKHSAFGGAIKSTINIWDYLDDFPANRSYDKVAFLNCDATMATSDRLFEKAMDLSAEYKTGAVITKVPNACDGNITYNDEDTHRTHENPNLTYIGAIATWIMWNEVFEFAYKNFDKVTINLIGDRYLMGDEFNGLGFDIMLQKYPNIKECGHFRHHMLPQLYSVTDVYFLPFTAPSHTSDKNIADIMLATNPIKFWEYLETGKPIFTSSLPEVFKLCTENNLPGVFFADTEEELTEQLHNLDRFKLYPEHREFAKQNTWMHRATQMDELITSLLDAGINRQAKKGMTQLI